MSIADIFPRDERDDLADKHATDPQPGDYWHEMYTPVCVVLGVAAGMVIYCENTKPASPNTWTWDLSVRQAKSLEDFKRMLEYGPSVPGRYYANVEPELHKWVLKRI